MRLVADIGGTNARLAFAQDRVVVLDSVRSYRNDQFDGFLTLVRTYLAQSDARDVSELIVAVAGPVLGDQARLTNRDWRFDANTLSADLGLRSVTLINDLSALGHALPSLSRSHLMSIYETGFNPAVATQSLIVGIGTGFNVSPVLHFGDTVRCVDTEFGHVSLMGSVLLNATPELRNVFDKFSTVEECFSGRGYQAVMRHGGTPAEYAALMGALTRDLLMAFMPRSGIYFNGGVARSVLSSPARSEFVRVFQQPFELSPDLTAPVALINDDTAALIGCARVALTERFDNEISDSRA